MNVSITVVTNGNPGSSEDFQGGVVPRGYFPEDGSEVSKALYGRLYEAIGDTHGISSDPAKFKLPDSRGRGTIGAGQGAGLTNRILGDRGGSETHLLTINEMPSHNHGGGSHTHTVDNVATPVSGGGIVNGGSGNNPQYISVNTNNSGAIIANQGGGNAHNNMQPYLVVTKIIKF